MSYVRTLIIGGGFSAFISKAVFPGAKVLSHSTKTHSQYSQKKFEINKLLTRWAPSTAKLQICKKDKISLHSRCVLGGSTQVWGGFINTRHLSIEALTLLKKAGVDLKRLSADVTGSVSNHDSAYQMHNDGRILDVSKILIPDFFGDAECVNINNKKKQVLYTDETGKQKKINCDNIIIACGVLKTLELLMNSEFITPFDTLKLSEHEHFFTLKKSKILDRDSFTIGYTIDRAFRHFLGAQKNAGYMNPKLIFIWQVFNKKRVTLNFTIKNSIINPARIVKNFGSSVHYCDLQLDGIGINDALAKKNTGLHIVGMAGTNQMEPGPISNDIIQHILSLRNLIEH